MDGLVFAKYRDQVEVLLRMLIVRTNSNVEAFVMTTTARLFTNFVAGVPSPVWYGPFKVASMSRVIVDPVLGNRTGRFPLVSSEFHLPQSRAFILH